MTINNLVKPIADSGIPFTAVFGNHDDEETASNLAKKAVELGCEILPFSVEVLKRGCSLDILSKEELSYCIIEQIINSFQVCKV